VKVSDKLQFVLQAFFISFSPGFNRVICADLIFGNRFNGLPLLVNIKKPLKRFRKSEVIAFTRLKPGENEMRRST